MDRVDYPVWDGDRWLDVPIPAMQGEAIVVPNVAGLVTPADGTDRLLLQRRDKPGEPARGLLEIPGGRWRAGEDPLTALRREIEEETGLTVESVEVELTRTEAQPRRPFVGVQPFLVTVGLEGAYPALIVVFECIASGTPRPLPGETAEPRWYERIEVEALLAEPGLFTGPTLVTLQRYLGD